MRFDSRRALRGEGLLPMSQYQKAAAALQEAPQTLHSLRALGIARPGRAIEGLNRHFGFVIVRQPLESWERWEHPHKARAEYFFAEAPEGAPYLLGGAA